MLACAAAVLHQDLPPGGGLSAATGPYPWHTDIVATTFWVGEIFDAAADDGSQRISTYDDEWERNYGGCDGIRGDDGSCRTEPRTAANGYLPSAFVPLQNPFYLDVPYDDVNDPIGFALRPYVVPWATDWRYVEHARDRRVSLMKDRWVELRRDGHTCFAQVEDAGPGQYHDVAYVFGTDDERPRNRRFNGAGVDVSPALNGCLHFTELDGESDRLDWRFVERDAVPDGPWTAVITTTPTPR